MLTIAPCVVLGALIITTDATSQETAHDPPDLARLQHNRDRAIERALRPIHETYRRELEKLKVKYTKAGKLEEAVAVQNELKKQGVVSGTNAAKIPETRALTDFNASRFVGLWGTINHPYFRDETRRLKPGGKLDMLRGGIKSPSL